MGRAIAGVLLVVAACGHTYRHYAGPARGTAEVATISDGGYRGTAPGRYSLFLSAIDGNSMIDPSDEEEPSGAAAEVLPGSHSIEVMWLTWREENYSTAGTVGLYAASTLLSLLAGSPMELKTSSTVPDQRGYFSFDCLMEQGHRYSLSAAGPPKTLPLEVRGTPELTRRYMACWHEAGAFVPGAKSPLVVVWVVDRTGIERVLRAGGAR